MTRTDQPSGQTRILFASSFRAPFIDDDRTMLAARYRLSEFVGSGIGHAFRVFAAGLRSDLVFFWFASVYAGVGVFAARIAGIPSFVVVGGVDAAKNPELGYGIWLSPWRSRFVRYAFRHASHILVVDPSLQREAVRLAEYDGKNIIYLPTGYDVEFWRPMGEKERSVLTVAVVRDMTTARRKGIDVLVDAARRVPEISFTIVGVIPAISEKLDAPPNMRFVPPVPRAEILPFVQRAKVYCQPSRFEGLPNAL